MKMQNVGKTIWMFALLFALVAFLAACGGDTSSEEEAGADAGDTAVADADAATNAFKTYKFGYNTWGAGVPILDLFGDEVEYVIQDILGMSGMRASDDFTADKELQNVQNFASAGVDGMILNGAAESLVPQIAQVCKDAEIPFVLHVFIGTDEDMAKIAAANPYYVGSVDAQMVRDGEEMGKAAYEGGARTAVLIGGNVGDSNHDQRSEGFRKGFESLGGTVLDEARCTDNSECLQKATAMLNAHPDVDALYAMAGDYTPGSLQAIKDLGLGTKMYISNVDAVSGALIKSGDIEMANDGIGFASFIAATLMINRLDGHPILDPDGNPPYFRTIPFKVTRDNVDAYLSVFASEDVYPMTPEMLEKLCYRFNPDVTYQDYLDLIENGLTLNTILEAHGLPTVDE